MPRRIKCPITKHPTVDQCKVCEYRESCLEDILNDFEKEVMKLASKAIKKIREVITKHEKSTN